MNSRILVIANSTFEAFPLDRICGPIFLHSCCSLGQILKRKAFQDRFSVEK